ncbi:MAG: DUF3761 domain-containing protein [Gemmatimonadales bacterium]
MRHEMTPRIILAAASACILVAAPAAAEQRSPTAHCNDGTYYYGTSRREACAHHRGVSEWLGSVSRSQLRSATPRRSRHSSTAHRPPQPATHRPPFHPRPAGATARCKDGTWSKDPRRAGACGHHGGIASWLGRR